MSISPTVWLLSVAIGLPLMLLALGVLYHAYVLGRQPAVMDDLDAHVEALATESADALLVDLQETVERMQAQLARQRDSLAGLLSEEVRRPRTPAMAPAMSASMAAPALPSAPAHQRAPMAAGGYVENPRATSAPRRALEETPRPAAPLTMGNAVAQLVSEGLSDRAIARRLRVGLEEVRIARMRTAR